MGSTFGFGDLIAAMFLFVWRMLIPFLVVGVLVMVVVRIVQWVIVLFRR